MVGYNLVKTNFPHAQNFHALFSRACTLKTSVRLLRFQKIVSQFKPTNTWGPLLVKHRVKVCHLQDFDVDPHWMGMDDDAQKIQNNNVQVRQTI